MTSTGPGEPPLDSTRTRRAGPDFTVQWLIRTLVVIAVALVAFAAVALLLFRGGGEDTEVVGAARIAWNADRDDPLGEGKAASVEILEDGDGYSVFVFDLEVLRPPADIEFIEVWLVDDDADPAQRLSAGRFDDIRTRVFALPDGIDPIGFDTVEFSLEPDDGDDSYSGRTLIEGELVWLTDPPG